MLRQNGVNHKIYITESHIRLENPMERQTLNQSIQEAVVTRNCEANNILIFEAYNRTHACTSKLNHKMRTTVISAWAASATHTHTHKFHGHLLQVENQFRKCVQSCTKVLLCSNSILLPEQQTASMCWRYTSFAHRNNRHSAQCGSNFCVCLCALAILTENYLNMHSS